MKFLRTLLIVSFLMYVFTFPIYAMDETVVLSIENTNAKVDNIVKLPVNISNNTGISSFGFIVNYDSKYLIPISVDKELWNEGIIFNPNYNNNQAFITGATVNNISQDGILFYINFKVKNEAKNIESSNISLDIKQLKQIVDTSIVDVKNNAIDGKVNIDYISGDVDFDYVITANDAYIVLQYVCDKESFKNEDFVFTHTDFDNDNYITANDAAFILKKVIEEET